MNRRVFLRSYSDQTNYGVITVTMPMFKSKKKNVEYDVWWDGKRQIKGRTYNWQKSFEDRGRVNFTIYEYVRI